MVRAGGQRVSAARSHGTGRGGEPGAAETLTDVLSSRYECYRCPLPFL